MAFEEPDFFADAVELVDPQTGEVVDATDADELIDALESVKQREQDLKTQRQGIEARLAAMSTAGTKTSRVCGRRRQVKIEMPGDAWDQSKLKESFLSYPQFRDDYLRIEHLGVKLVEFRKALNTTAPKDFETFIGMVNAANLGPRGMPYLTIEK